MGYESTIDHSCGCPKKLTIQEINLLMAAKTIDAFTAAIPVGFSTDVRLIATLAHSLGMLHGQKLEKEFPRQPEGY